jgi:predicted ATPase
MRIRSILLNNVRAFVHFEKSFDDPWSGTVPEALLLLGPNGSGKSTMLDAIAALWQGLAQALRLKDSGSSGRVSRELSVGMAAVEILELDPHPLWLYAYSRRDSTLDFVRQHPDSHRVGLFAPAGLGSRSSLLYYAAPGESDTERVSSNGEYGGWVGQLAQRITDNMLGKSRDFPNVVYLESEARSLVPIREPFNVQPEPEEFRWLARYEPTASRRGSVQNYLYNLKVVNENAYDEIVRQVNAFLSGKRLEGFDPATGKMMIAPIQGNPHPVEDLSSGEKQVLLMLATITRWLRPGGIVLIDEPDLHLHVALATALVSHLRQMVTEKGGQLIIATHVPEIWSQFTESHQVRLGTAGVQEHPL